MCSHRHAILHLPAKFLSNRTIVSGVMTLCPFSKWRPAAILDLICLMLHHPRSAIVGVRLVLNLNFGFNPIYSFGDKNAIFIFCRFGWKLHFTPILGSFWGIFLPNMIIHRSNPKNDYPCAETRRISHKA